MSVRAFDGIAPRIHPSAWIDPEATVIGDVRIGEDASLWPGAVVRGDVAPITIGPRSSIQDGSVLHVTHDGPYSPGGRALTVGAGVTVGHRVVLHACTVRDDCLIGMGAIVMDGAVVGAGSIVAAGSLVPEHREVPPRTLWMGAPARQIRVLDDETIERLRYSAGHYVRLKDRYRSPGGA